MAWQKLYGEISDENAKTVRTSSSRFGLNKYVSYSIHTENQRNSVEVDSNWADGEEETPTIDLRFVKKTDRGIIKRLYKKLFDIRDRYTHNITIKFSKQETFYINGEEITEKKLARLARMK